VNEAIKSQFVNGQLRAATSRLPSFWSRYYWSLKGRSLPLTLVVDCHGWRYSTARRSWLVRLRRAAGSPRTPDSRGCQSASGRAGGLRANVTGKGTGRAPPPDLTVPPDGALSVPLAMLSSGANVRRGQPRMSRRKKNGGSMRATISHWSCLVQRPLCYSSG
jgi:hypothetical protein